MDTSLDRSLIGDKHGNSAMELVYKHVTALNLNPDDTIIYWDSGWKNLVKSITTGPNGKGWNGTFRTNLPAAITGKSHDKPANDKTTDDKPASAKPASAKSGKFSVVADVEYGIVHITPAGMELSANVKPDGSVYLPAGLVVPLMRPVCDFLARPVEFLRKHVSRKLTFTLIDITVESTDPDAAKKTIMQSLFDADRFDDLKKYKSANVIQNPDTLDPFISKWYPDKV
jgi:hypothetical protein